LEAFLETRRRTGAKASWGGRYSNVKVASVQLTANESKGRNNRERFRGKHARLEKMQRGFAYGKDGKRMRTSFVKSLKVVVPNAESELEEGIGLEGGEFPKRRPNE